MGGGGTPVLFFLPNIVLQCITKVHFISIFLFKVLSGRTDEFARKNIEWSQSLGWNSARLFGTGRLLLGERLGMVKVHSSLL